MQFTNTRAQILCAWAGPCAAVLLAPVMLPMGFVPVPSPSLGPEEVAALYAANRGQILFGSAMLMQLIVLCVLWSAAIAAQFRRIETGPAPVLSYGFVGLSAVTFSLFIPPSIAWTVAAYRPERDIHLISMLHDWAWFYVVMPVFPLSLMGIVAAWVILSDKRTEPIFPRWAGYLSLWCAIITLPAAFAGFYKTGPFAWHGIFDFYIPLTAITGWIVTMALLVTRAARRQALEEARGGSRG